MSQKIKDVLTDWKTYASMLVGLFGFLNNYLHLFMPLAPSLRLQANVFVILVPLIGVGITISKVHDKKKTGQHYEKWAAWLAGIWTALGCIAWAAYAPIVTYLESHSTSLSVSQWFDALQTGAYVLPFLCWGIALAALLSLFF
jgi:hypothetical protein